MTDATELQDLPLGTPKGASSKPFEFKGQIPQNELSAVELGEQPQPQERATEALQQWNNPRINIWRYLAAVLGFIVMGMNDAAYGVCQN